MGLSLSRKRSINEDISNMLYSDNYDDTKKLLTRIYILMIINIVIIFIITCSLVVSIFIMKPGIETIANSAQRLAKDFNTTANYFVSDLSEIIKLGMRAIMVMQECSSTLCHSNQ